jgi:hypothetical protein
LDQIFQIIHTAADEAGMILNKPFAVVPRVESDAARSNERK